MKLKNTIMVMILSMFATHAFALEGKGFRVLSETIESSPGVIGGFVQKPVLVTKRPLYLQTWAQAYSAQGRTRQNIRLDGNHMIYISNYSNQKQTYTYKYELNYDGQYFRKIDHIEVAPGGFATDSANSYLYTLHNGTGLWGVTAYTEVSGAETGHYTGTGTLRVVN